MKGDDINRRFIELAVRVIKLVRALPKDFIGKHIGNQLLKAGTSGGANYEEAGGSESKVDFIHKRKIVLKELRESIFWIKVIMEAELIPSHKLENILQEFEELANIIAKSIITTQKKLINDGKKVKS
ncbi:MAG: four helix bundle protein [Candidatus Cloacimonetes bacterium]|nr:four helix bundle protein [Candidatus Cloacimonadota bacterium]